MQRRIERIEQVRRVGGAERSTVEAALVAEREVRAWLDAANSDLVALLSAQASFPEAAVAEVSRCTAREASRATERSATLDRSPVFAHALNDGAVTAGHIDAITRGAKRVDPARRDELLGRIDALVDVASAATPEQFERRIRREVRLLESDDGTQRLERQQRNVRLSSWTDDEGMWCVRGRFDPVLGVRVSAALDRVTEALFSEAVPAHCPDDPVEKQRFLRAHAFARLAVGNAATEGGSDHDPGGGAVDPVIRRTGRPEYVVVIDADAPHGRGHGDGPSVDWPIDVEVPARVLRQLTDEGNVVPVVVRNGVVLHAPGNLDLGRATRLANRAQRRALRAMYATCCIPGCNVHFDRCKIHHVEWWRHGGRTDLANLIPICARHHSSVHDGGWVIELGSGRELTLRLPDGTIRNTGPPRRTAA